MLRFGIDSDNDASTGCAFDPGTGSIRQGVDVILEVHIDGGVTPPIVFSTSYGTCEGGGFSSPVFIDGGWPVGLNNGLSGSDVVEAALPVYLLGVTRQVAFSAGIADDHGLDDTSGSIVFQQTVPLLGTWGLILFFGLLLLAGLWFLRRTRQKTLLLLAGVVLLAVGNSSFILDGKTFDWINLSPVVIDQSGEIGSTPRTDLRAVYGCVEGANLYFRVDIADLENAPPVATNDFAMGIEDEPVSLNVLANDSDPDMDPFTITMTLNSSGGSVVFNPNGELTFTPNPDLNGSTFFRYIIEDCGGLTDTGIVILDFEAVNDPPVANNDSFVVDENSGSHNLDVLANDSPGPDVGDVLSITALGMPNHGGTVIIAGVGSSINYTPAANFSGTETFTYTITDSGGSSASATVTVTVNPAPDVGNRR